MPLYAPDYYTEFKCAADKCRHNCCIGWEIDIDAESLDFYKSVTGRLGERLKENITGGATPCFKLKNDGRCPFLNSNNLCDIITELGEHRLCQICADHPRFRNVFKNRTEIGLGLSCEAAAELILTRHEKTEIICLDGVEATLTDTEKAFLNLRERIFAAVQDRSKGFAERAERVLDIVGAKPTNKSTKKWADIFLELERLDSDWTTELSNLKDTDCADTDILKTEKWELFFEQLLIYFIFRHLHDGLFDGCIPERVAFSVLSCRMIQAICAAEYNKNGKLDTDYALDICRMYSAEIEYSDSNIDTLLEILNNA